MFSRPWNPANRFDPRSIEWEVEPDKARLRLIEDASSSILAHNDSPDIGFSWSVNPYRGCTHACAYCYARPTHEYLGYGAGTDFERTIVYKPRAGELLAAAFERPSWAGAHVMFSGVTDCYQPVERRLRLTRACLEVCARYRNPVAVITRSPLVVRDLDLLVELAALGASAVTFSLPLLDPALARALEPGAPSPHVRLAAMAQLAAAGVPVGVSVAPVIPGIGTEQIPNVLKAARDAGARWAWMIPIRLPGAVAEVFPRRLREALPLRAEAILTRILRLRGGVMNEARFGARFEGRDDDPVWISMRDLFSVWRDRLRFGAPWQPPDPSPFRRPSGQLDLFGT